MNGYVVKECLRWIHVNEFRMNLSFSILNLLIERNENMLQNAPIWHWVKICIENMGYKKNILNLFNLFWKTKAHHHLLRSLGKKEVKEQGPHPT